MWVFLEPIDVWLFRDGRPFDARSDHRAQSLFPPYPTVIQGALRSHYLTVRGVDLQDTSAIAALVGTASDVRGLRLRGPFAARREAEGIMPYFPVPADARLVPGRDRALRAASKPERPDEGVISSAPAPRLLGLHDAPGGGATDLWLGERALAAYLRGEAIAGLPARELFCRESRAGIGRDDATRTTREEFLYEVEFVRPAAGAGLLVEVQGYDGWPQSGVLRLGGEGRAARFEQVWHDPWPAPPDPLPPRFKAYFATPAYFDGGWQPAGGWGDFFSGQVQLVAAALRGYESVGGYDWAANRQKTAHRYVPAGSVYYFEAGAGARLQAAALTQCPTGPQYEAAIGFGQVLIEEW